MTIRKEVLAEGVELYCGDCRDILPTLGKVDAVVTDPPYGMAFLREPDMLVAFTPAPAKQEALAL